MRNPLPCNKVVESHELDTHESVGFTDRNAVLEGVRWRAPGRWRDFLSALRFAPHGHSYPMISSNQTIALSDLGRYMARGAQSAHATAAGGVEDARRRVKWWT